MVILSLSWEDVEKRVYDLASRIIETCPKALSVASSEPPPEDVIKALKEDNNCDKIIAVHSHNFNISVTVPSIRIFGVPRGGIYAALLVAAELNRQNIETKILECPDTADIIVDDIIDTGETKESYGEAFDDANFMALVDKTKEESLAGVWVSFPWERINYEKGPTDNIRRLIEYIGDDPTREGLLETPDRVIRSYKTLYGGYNQNPKDVIRVFEDDSCDEMVIVRDISFYSTCEHHMLPFFGKAHIAYIPNGRVIGVSKLIRILEMYARRLTIQERIVQQVTNALQNNLNPKGAACVLEGQHFCMTSRGVEKQDSIMVTSSLTGSFKESIETRNEFLKMIGR